MLALCHDTRYDGVMTNNNLIRVQTAATLVEVYKSLGVDVTWHEPDNSGVDAYVIGAHLDNAMGSRIDPIPSDDPTNPSGEFNVVITKDGEPFAVVNLAMLLAWGTFHGMKL